MVDEKPAYVRKDVDRLIEAGSGAAGLAETRRLVSRAFTPAQHAEAVERGGNSSSCADPDLNGQLKAVAESNIRNFVAQLYTACDRERRQTLRTLLLEEGRWFGSKREWAETIRRLLRDCDGDVLRCRDLFDKQQAAGVATEEAQQYLDNLLDVQLLLQNSLGAEMIR